MKTSLYAVGIALVFSACQPESSSPNDQTTVDPSLAINALSPANGAQTVSVKTDLTVTLSHSLDSSAFDGSELTVRSSVTDREVTGLWVYDEPNSQLVFTPDYPLATETTYTVELNESLISEEVDALTDVSWSFTTTEDYNVLYTNVSEECSGNCDYEVWAWDEDGLAIQIANINDDGGSNAYISGSKYKGLYWFSAYTADHGTEIWVSDGTPYYTELFADLIPGTDSSQPGSFTILGDYLYFVANSGEDTERGVLWRTDGTVDGTEIWFNPRSDTGSANARNLYVLDDRLVFTAYGDDDNGTYVTDAIYATDGTEVGTGFVIDINPVNNEGAGFQDFAEFNGKLLFHASDGNDTDTDATQHSYSLFITDGTAAGTQLVKDINPTENDSSEARIERITVLGDIAIFEARDGTNGQEIWRTDGTDAGTYMLKDITEGDGSSSISAIVEWDGTVYFGVEDSGLWKTDGTAEGTVLVKSFDDITSIDAVDKGLLFFAETGDDVGIWLSDGTSEGTELNYPSNSLRYVYSSIGRVAFFTDNAEGDYYYYMTDGTYEGTDVIRSEDGLRFINEPL